MLFVGGNDFTDKAVADDILPFQIDEVNTFDVLKDVLHLYEAALASML
jgi:hypothetical protein